MRNLPFPQSPGVVSFADLLGKTSSGSCRPDPDFLRNGTLGGRRAAGSWHAAPATLSVAAEQQLVEQYCSGCHNYDDYAGGVEFEVFDATNAHQDAKLTERMVCSA
jgi:mono/diheme cytochrome c family protein